MTEDKKVNPEGLADDVENDDIDDSDESKNTADYIKKLKAEAKSQRLGKAAEKKEKEDYKAKLDALEAEKLTELEKEKKKSAEWERKYVDIQTGYKDKETESRITKAMIGKNLIKEATKIIPILAKQELDSEEEISDEIVEKIVEKIIKENSYLISSGTANPSDGNFAKTDKVIAKDPDEMFGEMIRVKRK